MENQIRQFIKEQEAYFINLSHQIHEHPEIANEEYFACELLTNVLKERGFDVKTNIAGHETGFVSRYIAKKPGPVIGFLAEYDALAGLGHGCGHNIIGVSSVLAACSLAPLLELTGGEVIVFGTPAEEGGNNGSAKASFVRAGLFDDVDACMMIHPGNKAAITTSSLSSN